LTTKQTILGVSLQLFMQSGFESTYMDAIAEKAGVTKPAIYYYFKDKQALFEASASFFLDQMAQMMLPDGVEDLPLKELIFAAFGSLPESMSRYQRMSGIEEPTSLLRSQMFIYDAMTRVPDFRLGIGELYGKSAQLLQQTCERAAAQGQIRSGIDGSTFGILVNSMIEGLILMSMMDPHMNLEILGRKSAETVWRMVET